MGVNAQGGGIESDIGEQKFAQQERKGVGGGWGWESEIRNLLSHHDWSHDDRSAAATIVVLYWNTHTHAQVWEMRGRQMHHTKHLIESWSRCSSVELCALRTDLIFSASPLPLCWLLIHTVVSPSFCLLLTHWYKYICIKLFSLSHCLLFFVFILGV